MFEAQHAVQYGCRLLHPTLCVTAWQGRRIGSGLLKDAMQRTLQAADIGGIRAFAVHAKDAPATKGLALY
jgi:hypothetical protein